MRAQGSKDTRAQWCESTKVKGNKGERAQR